MQTMDNALLALFNAGRITRDSAIAYAQDKTTLSRKLKEKKLHVV